MNFVFLTGGVGLEREVSINSANNFLNNVIDLDMNFHLIYLTKNYDYIYKNEVGDFNFFDKKLYFKTNLIKLQINYVFPVVHGKGVENGEIQSFFKFFYFKNLLSNSLFSSCLSFDKIISKRIAESLYIPVVPYIDFFSNVLDFENCKKTLNSEILFMKPSDNGSSFGCSMILNENDYNSSIQNLKTITNYPLIEKYMEVIECSCSICFDEVSDVIVINHGLNFFSYDAKYEDHLFKIEFLQDQKLVALIQKYSLQLFKAMRLDFLCRFDFFICKKTKRIYFNEVNSLPGFGRDSLFFHCFSSKYTQQNLCKKIIMQWIENNK